MVRPSLYSRSRRLAAGLLYRGMSYHLSHRRASVGRAGRGRWVLTVPDLKSGLPEACTLLRCKQVQDPRSEQPDPVLKDAPRSLRHMVLRLPISPEGIGGLVRLGWVSLRDAGDPAAVADGVIDLADAALATGLRPRL